MAKNLTKDQRKKIIELFDSGLGIREVARRLMCTANTVRRWAGANRRTLKESNAISRKLGGYKLTDAGRAKLSEVGKRLCRSSGKMWTKPEREFKQILNECGVGVRFPSDIKQMFGLTDDTNAIVYFQYPIQRYVCDFVDIDKKVVYAVNGDYWHANPLLYSGALSKIQNHNIHHDKQRERYLQEKGFVVCNIWESEIKWNREAVKERIRACSLTVKTSGLHPEDSGINTHLAHADWSHLLRSLWFKPKNQRPRREIQKKSCLFCKNGFETKITKQVYCCLSCSSKNRQKVPHPTKEQLRLEIENTGNFCAIGRKYGVTDNAVRKWAKKYALM